MHKSLYATLLAGLFLAPFALAGHTETKTYDIAFQNLSGNVADPAPGISPDGTVLDYGGVLFTPFAGETHISFSIADAAGGAPAFVACQDANLDMICGGAGEPRSSGCGAGELTIAPSGGDVRVFVTLQSAVAPSVGQMSVTPLPCGDNIALGTTGSVTAVFN